MLPDLTPQDAPDGVKPPLMPEGVEHRCYLPIGRMARRGTFVWWCRVLHGLARLDGLREGKRR